jgi:hypothetical protein
MSERKINTSYNPKPMPARGFDWCATFDGYEPGDPMGYGATEEAAVKDLHADDEFAKEGR